ncbi:PAC2 family protein [Actinomyces sp. zg-332]|uniref:PAC2 family protein n=1 Tax=Actinomyces sp. zg-332 TaxID=2708340 RepID=UPI001423FBFB|nr:PAC2 family protein [Actinomyces sp. zg-332]QPK94415.1 PAC2 family protein [Actinomyces sp. zg-332]
MDSLYEVDNVVDVKTPILLHNLEGNLGAGHASFMVTRHLFNTLKSVRIATFKTDELVDMKAYRPLATFDDWCLEEVNFVNITLDLLYDDKGTSFLMLSGPEPSRCWGKFAKSIIELIKPYGVEKAYTLAGISTYIPHTRKGNVDVTITNRKYDKERKQSNERIRVLATMDVFLQYEMSKANIDCFGLVVPVPFYLADSDFPQGAYMLLEKFTAMTNLVLPLGDLAVACELADGMMSNSQEIAENEGLIRGLEEQFDSGNSVTSNIGVSEKQNVSAENFPSGDELAESIEAFLKSQSETDNDIQKSVKSQNDSYGFLKRLFGKK